MQKEIMLIYNTTYHVEEGQEKYFLTWMQEFYLPEVEKHGALYAPRIARILSHIEEGSVCYSVQFEVENSAILHRWHQEQGVKLNEELLKIFKDKVIGFPTLMEVVVIQPVKEKIILGIDPGTTIMGYGVLRVAGTKPEMIAMGIIDLRKFGDHYLKLRHIHERVLGIIESYLPDELAIEAPFFGKNVQSMLKLGRAQGVAMAAALSRDIPITEYAPLKIKMAITGNGQASKEQVADMLQRMLHFPKEEMPVFMDATDGLAAAYCHFLQMGRPVAEKGYHGWKDFIAKNPDKVKR
jgi:crossover junction endodeoxyribonuclease RuvC